MSCPEIEKITEAYLEALSSRGDFGRFFTDTVTIELPGSSAVLRITGRDAVEEFIRNFHAKAFEAAVSVRRVLSGHGGSTAELVFEGVHTGEFAGIPATGTQVSLPYCAAYDFTGGAISAIRIYMSMAELIAQIES